MANSQASQNKRRMISPISLGATGSGGKVSVIIDRAGFQDVAILVGYGTVTATNATVTPTIKDGDVTSALSVVTAANILGALGLGATTARVSGVSKNCSRSAQYLGLKRYVQVTLAPAASGGIIAFAEALLGKARTAPVASPT